MFCPIIEIFIWIEPLLRGHLSYKRPHILCPKGDISIQGWLYMILKTTPVLVLLQLAPFTFINTYCLTSLTDLPGNRSIYVTFFFSVLQLLNQFYKAFCKIGIVIAQSWTSLYLWLSSVTTEQIYPANKLTQNFNRYYIR